MSDLQNLHKSNKTKTIQMAFQKTSNGIKSKKLMKSSKTYEINQIKPGQI